jgi:hypothetical protein
MTLYPLRDAYGVTNMVVAWIEGSAPLSHPIKFHGQLTPIPVTGQERKTPSRLSIPPIAPPWLNRAPICAYWIKPYLTNNRLIG